MKYIFLIIAIYSSIIGFSQSVSPQVINTGGGTHTVQANSAIYQIAYNIGEAVVTPISSNSVIITQGFLQPDMKSATKILSASAFINQITCIDSTNGSIDISATYTATGGGGLNNYFLKYTWTPSGLCASNTCSTVSNLAAGNYSVFVSLYNYSNGINYLIDSVSISNIIINSSTEICGLLNPYSGFTPNGDGINDIFYIEGIENYPKNHVEIYNRWGQQLDYINGYNNVVNSWKGFIRNTTQPLPSGTYFYIIYKDDTALNPIKGWIELTTN